MPLLIPHPPFPSPSFHTTTTTLDGKSGVVVLPADAPSTADPTDRSEFTTVESKAERKKKREQEDQRRAAEERAEAKERARVEKREAAQKREQAAQRKKEADRNWATTVTPALGKLSELELPAVRPTGEKRFRSR